MVAVHLVFWSLSLSIIIIPVQQSIYTHSKTLKHLCSIRAWVPVSFSLSLSFPRLSLFHFFIFDSGPPGSGPLNNCNTPFPLCIQTSILYIYNSIHPLWIGSSVQFFLFHVVVVQSSSHVQHFATPLTAACQASLSLTISWSLPKFMNWWCHPTSSSSVTLLSFCLQLCPASGSFPVSQLLASGGQSTGASASASVLPVSTQGWFPLRQTVLISLLSKRLSLKSSLAP